jgi:deoxyribose-phosphate aldolase
MNGDVVTRLEIDVLQANELLEASELALKYNLPALVVHPTLMSDALVIKGGFKGRYRLITAVDWPRGETFGMAKMHGLSIDALEADGYEIVLTPGKQISDTRNEVRALTEFVKSRLAEISEVRFVFNSNGKDVAQITAMAEGLMENRTPAYVRNDISVKTQMTHTSINQFKLFTDTVHSKIKVPIKLSGNINGIGQAINIHWANRYGVNVNQARTIIRQFSQQPVASEIIGDTST